MPEIAGVGSSLPDDADGVNRAEQSRRGGSPAPSPSPPRQPRHLALFLTSRFILTGSRALYGLALNGKAPKFLRKVTSWGLPYYAVAVGSAFALLSFM